jgi:hypothetical protein
MDELRDDRKWADIAGIVVAGLLLLLLIGLIIWAVML